jgi:hypothetical protein
MKGLHEVVHRDEQAQGTGAGVYGLESRKRLSIYTKRYILHPDQENGTSLISQY